MLSQRKFPSLQVIIFGYLYDKDIFQKFYAKMLAKRLIHATSASEEVGAVLPSVIAIASHLSSGLVGTLYDFATERSLRL